MTNKPEPTLSERLRDDHDEILVNALAQRDEALDRAEVAAAEIDRLTAALAETTAKIEHYEWGRANTQIEMDERETKLTAASARIAELEEQIAGARKEAIEECVDALRDHYGFTDDEKRIATAVLHALQSRFSLPDDLRRPEPGSDAHMFPED